MARRSSRLISLKQEQNLVEKNKVSSSRIFSKKERTVNSSEDESVNTTRNCENMRNKKERRNKEERTISSSEDESVSTTRNCENAGLSEYEKQILQNIEERKKMFEMLVGDAKKSFMEVVPQRAKEDKKANQRGLKRKTEESAMYDFVEVSPLRMSLRSRKQPQDTAVEQQRDIKGKTVKTPTKIDKTGRLTMDQTYYDQESTEDTKLFQEMIPLLEKEGELEKLPSDQQEFLKTMKALKLHGEDFAKVVPNRIYSVSWHPSTCKLLIAAGDRNGYIGFWDVDNSEDKLQGVRSFKVHSLPVNCTTFDKFNPTRVLTTSYDGYVRCLDFLTNIFDPVYCVKRTNSNWTAYHAQRDPSTLLVSQSNGKVVVVDVRTKPGRPENTISCFEVSTRTLSLHPTDDNLFMVCNRNGKTGIFDLRYQSENEDDLAVPLMSFEKESKGVHSAFFSPITGKYALVTCAENYLKLYDVQQNKEEAECIKVIEHNNFTGQWLTPLKAVWHPQREDVFVVGSLLKPRRIELYGAPDCQLLHNISGESLSTVTSINAFHPTLSMLAGGNASGRVYVFRP